MGKADFSASRKKILLFGDYITDEYIIGESNELSYEAPIPIIKKKGTQYFTGGVGNLAGNIVSLGGECDLVSIVGKDHLEKLIFSNLESYAIGTKHIIKVKDRSNSIKTRIICNGKQIVRMDEDVKEPLKYDEIYLAIDKILADIKGYDLIMIQDLGKDFLNTDIIEKITSKASVEGIKVILDLPSDVSNYSISKENNISIIKTNLNGFKRMLGISLDSIIEDKEKMKKLSDVLLEKYGISAMVVTMGMSGVFYNSGEEEYHIDGYEAKVFDVTGAGDSAAAALALCTAADIEIIEGLKIVNLAGFLACNYTGAVAISAEELVEGYSVMHSNPPTK